MTGRETALNALQATIAAALAPLADDVILKPRNTPLAERIDVAAADGNSQAVGTLTDGAAQGPAPLLGEPPLYDHVQNAVFELIAIHPDSDKRDAGMDAALLAIDAAILADPTLGGAVSFAGTNPPSASSMDEDGVPGGKAAELQIDLLFTTTSPLG